MEGHQKGESRPTAVESEKHRVPSEKAISLCSARMTGEMVVTSAGQMTCFIWMFSTAGGQADESRHIAGMSSVPARSTLMTELSVRRSALSFRAKAVKRASGVPSSFIQ